jgi:hypothetical protein
MKIAGHLVVLAILYTGAVAGETPQYVVQSNDMDPTMPTSQPGGRWYHWLGTDPAITHLETGMAIDADQFGGRGQRIDVAADVPICAVQVKMKRIGQPGPMRWQAGTAWGQSDLGHGEVPAEQVRIHYEHLITLPIQPTRVKQIFIRLRAASGRCPDDYYAVYCTWAQAPAEKAEVNSYEGIHKVEMMYRMVRSDPQGAALEADGKPVIEGSSMMTRLLSAQPVAGAHALTADEEEPYFFVEKLAAGTDPRLIGLSRPEARPEPGEIVISEEWQIRVAALRSPQVEAAVDDLCRFLRDRMKVRISPVWDNAAPPAARSIRLTQGPDLPDGSRRPAGYRFIAEGDRVHIHGYDARGVLRGVWYLEDLLTFRGGPFVRPGARTREPRYSPRTTCSTWGGIGELAASAPVYTDPHLALISHYGYDAIWMCWCPGPERTNELPTHIVPGRTPRGTSYQPFTSRLRELTERAERYDLEIVLQYAAPHPADEAQARALQDEARQLLRDVPKIRTIALLDEGMGSVNKGLDAWVSTCSLLAGAFWDVRPDANVIAWTYSFGATAGPPERPEYARYLDRMLRLDRRVGFMANFDSWWARRRDGLLQNAYDYCLSLKAPSDDYTRSVQALLAEANRDGRPARPLWAKIETRFSQESNTQPEIPCMQRWVRRYQSLNDFGPPPIAGVFGNWYHQGFHPTPVTELFGWLSYTNSPAPEELLRSIARRDFGAGQEDLVVGAWADFSEAIWHYPFYYNLSYTMNAGYAQPFWLDPKAKNPRPWRRGFVNSLQAMSMAPTGQGPGSGPENRARMAKLYEHWSAGLQKLRQAADAAPPCVKAEAESQWRTARSFGDKAEVTLRLVRWLDARDRFYAAKDRADAAAALDDLERTGREELTAARTALPLYLRDSRMGHLNHGRGCFTAGTIEWKIGLLDRTLAEELPKLRVAADESGK